MPYHRGALKLLVQFEEVQIIFFDIRLAPKAKVDALGKLAASPTILYGESQYFGSRKNVTYSPFRSDTRI